MLTRSPQAPVDAAAPVTLKLNGVLYCPPKVSFGSLPFSRDGLSPVARLTVEPSELTHEMSSLPPPVPNFELTNDTFVGVKLSPVFGTIMNSTALLSVGPLSYSPGWNVVCTGSPSPLAAFAL